MSKVFHVQEFSGLGSQQKRRATQQTQSADLPPIQRPGGNEKYLELKGIASSYSIMSMGVACFQWQLSATTSSGGIPCKVEVFDILLLSQRSYIIDPSAAKFLRKHGFDFNKQFTQGLSYTPVGVVGDDGDGEANESGGGNEVRTSTVLPDPTS